MCKQFHLWLMVVLTIGLSLSALADTGLARHKKLFAIPTPGKVVIDGKLDDWDLSSQITMYVVSETSDMQSAKFALMYDQIALYLSAEVRDPTPMLNRHDPKVEGDKGWDADACQFRLTLDPKMGYPINIGYGQGDMTNPNIVSMTLWNYTDRQEPCLTIQKGMNFNPVVPVVPAWAPFGVAPQTAFQAKYLKMADARGYTFEYRIPWATMGAKAPLQAGNLVAGTVQFNWGAPDGLKTAGGSAWAYDVMAGPGFPYQNTSCWGKLIFSDKGDLPKAIVEEGVLPARPLPLKFTYTLPEDSQITLQLMDKNNFVKRILVAQGDRKAGTNVEKWDGLDDQGHPLPAGDYAVKGIYHQPITQKYLFSPHNSGQPPYRTDDGTGSWGGDHGDPQDACAFPDGIILAWNTAEAGSGIIRTDLTGKRQWGTLHCATYLATDGKRLFSASDQGFNRGEGVKALDLADSRLMNFGNGTPNLAPPPGGNAANNEVTGLAYAGGVIYVSFKARNLLARYDARSGDLKDTWSVPAPGRLAPRPDGTLAVISGKTVVAVKDGKIAPLLVTHLDTPRGIAIGPDGTLYVTNAGALQNISVYAANGTYLRSIGKEGGRPRLGRYDPSGILEPGGIALDVNGHLWVAETLNFPKRVSEWDAKTGALVNEFFGGCGYFGWSYIDPTHPDEIYCHDVIWKVDWANNTCAPYSTIWRPTAPNMIEDPTPDGMGGHFRVMTAKNGKQYGWGMIDYGPVLFMRDGDLFKPIAGSIRIGNGLLYPAMKDIYAKTNAGAFLWQDKNNDQTVQEDELIVSEAGRGESMFNWIDKDLNVWNDAGFMYKPVRIEADGRPVYDFSKKDMLPFKGSNANDTSLIYDDEDGAVYTLSATDTGFARWTKDGKMAWSFGRNVAWYDALSLPMVTPGKLWGLTMPLGVAGDFTGAACYFGTYHVFTRDGIYVGMLMRDTRDGKGVGADTTCSEVDTGQLVKLDNLPGSNGKARYFLLAGAADARVTEVFGLDTVKRLPDSTLALSPTDAKTAADALAEYNTAVARGKRLSIARGKSGLGTADPISKAYNAALGFTVRASYDEANLYLSYDVTSPNDLLNSAPDPQILFKGGNCLDIQLATDPAADPKRKTPSPGDIRILVTRKDGKPFAVIYHPKVKNFKNEPIVLRSPTGQESFDVIEVSDKIGLDYQKTAGGYTAVVTLPNTATGLALTPGQQVKLDLGVIFGNATGNAVSARAYWINNGFSANVTNDVPNESRLEPAEWGMAVVE